MTEDQPYYYVRFCWWTAHDIGKLTKELESRFTVRKRPTPKEEETDMSLYKKERGEIEVKADTLSVFLSAYRAVLSQKAKAPFTERDMELRKTVLDLYPHSRPTPFPWSFSVEPKFEVKKST